jgi:osmoprotectant transport system substrate-binding protein
MHRFSRTLVTGLALGVAALGLVACGDEGSSGTEKPDAASGPGCAPIAGDKLVALTDDKKLQNADNILPAINAKASSPELIAALDKVSAVLDTPKVIALNKAVNVDRKTAEVAAKDFATSANITAGIAKGPGGDIIVGAANFSESQVLGNLYKIALEAAGYTVKVEQIGNRELYEPDLEAGKVQVLPEYAATLAEFINAKVNGAAATSSPIASPDVDKTAAALTEIGKKVGLTFGKPAAAATSNAFAVTTTFAEKYGVKTLSEFASKCSGTATVLGGPPECPQRPFCKAGLEKTYNLKAGKFSSLDAGGTQTKNALKTGSISIGLVFSTDEALAS